MITAAIHYMVCLNIQLTRCIIVDAIHLHIMQIYLAILSLTESTTSEGLTLVWAAIGTILVCASTAIIILLLMYILKRWKTGDT